jgi:hypothetical protein
MLFGDGIRELWHNAVEMDVLKQLEAGRAKDMCVLQNLHGVPITALNCGFN